MQNATSHFHRILFWMLLSVTLHGIAIAGLRTQPPPVTLLVDMNTLWVSAEGTVALVAHAKKTADQHSPSRSQPSPASDRAQPENTLAQQSPPLPDETSTTTASETGSDTEKEISNHMLGLIRRSIQEHFVYPPFAQQQGWEGEVLVSLQLNAEGEILDIRMVRSSGYRILDEDALLILQRIGSIPHAGTWLHGQQYSALIPIIYRLSS
jgi:protein TonB